MLNVLITVDVEFWPNVEKWPDRSLARSPSNLIEAYQRDVIGHTASGDLGLPFLLRTLRQHQLDGVFFVETLSSTVIGEPWLERTVRAIQNARQEVQLHVHTEWLSEAAIAGLPQTYRQNLGDFSLAEQTAIVRHGLAQLRDVGAAEVNTLRAGNMGGNQNTPSAARAAGLQLDMSFSPAEGPAVRRFLDGTGFAGACPTIPLSFVEDFPGHYRPANLTALSFSELRNALLNAVKGNWPCFVILLHTFELLQRRKNGLSQPHRINIARWERLCAFLAAHRHVMRTVGCARIVNDPAMRRLSPVHRTRPWDTLQRLGEQFISRLP